MGKYGERVHYCRLMYLHIVASLKTLYEKLQENSSRKKEYNLFFQDNLWPSGSYHFEFSRILMKGYYSREVLPLNLTELSRYAKNAFSRKHMHMGT